MAKLLPSYGDGFREPLFDALRREFPGRRPKFTVRAAMIVVNTFSKESEIVDYDNFDLHNLINCVAYYFFTDDSPIFYSMHMEYTMGDTAHTDIYIVPDKDCADFVRSLSLNFL